MEYLNDSLLRLRKAQRQNPKQPISQKAHQGEKRQSVKDNTRQSIKGLKEKSPVNDEISDTNLEGPSMTDKLCMRNYPISCISENWTNITCIVFVQYPSRPVHNSNIVLNGNSSVKLSMAKESQTCSNFHVNLENIE